MAAKADEEFRFVFSRRVQDDRVASNHREVPRHACERSVGELRKVRLGHITPILQRQYPDLFPCPVNKLIPHLHQTVAAVEACKTNRIEMIGQAAMFKRRSRL